MRLLKRLAGVMLAVVMSFSLATTAFAEEKTGTITVTNSTNGIQYSIYKVFNATLGDNDAIAYSADAPLPDNAYFATDEKLNVTVKEAAKASDGSLTAEAIEWLKRNYVTDQTPVATEYGNGGAITFDNVPYGYYVVTSTLNGGAAVTVTSTMPHAEVIDKNMGPSWDNEDPELGDPGKVIIENGEKKLVNSASFGETVNFSIAVNATSYVGKDLVTHYYIKDTLADGFDPAQNIVVKVGNQELVQNLDYTINQDGNVFQIDILFEAESKPKYDPNVIIEVTYSATVNSDAIIAGSGNLNTANFTYAATSNPSDPNAETIKPLDPANEKTTTTYVYAIGIKKVDPNGNALRGAEFTLTDAEGKAITATGDNGVYEYSASTADTVSQFKTDENGILIISGLKAGQYFINEAVAPDGYNILNGKIAVEASIEKTQSYTTTITTYYDKDGNVVDQDEMVTSADTTVSTNVVPMVIVNKAGVELPVTGGMGTILFYAVGSLLIAAALVLFVIKKRSVKSEE